MTVSPPASAARGPAPAHLGHKVVAVGLWLLGGTFAAFALTAFTVLHRVASVDTLDPLTRAYCRVQLALTFCRWDAHVDPAVHDLGPCLFLQNHVNVLDFVTMYPATPRVTQGMELASHFDIPFYGWAMGSRGTIGVDPGARNGLLTIRRGVKNELDAGRSVLAFPEGTRTRTGEVGPFQLGLFHLARALKVPIVPVAVTGMFEVLPTGSWVMRPFQKVDVHLLAPVPTAGVKRDEVEALAETVRSRIVEVVERYHADRAQGVA